MKHNLFLLGALLVAAGAFFLGRYSAGGELTERVVVDTTYVTLRDTLRLDVPVPEVRYVDRKVIRTDTLWASRVDTFLADCASDSLPLRRYETPFSDSLLQGVVVSDVFGTLIEQDIRYQITVPHIHRTTRRTHFFLLGPDVSFYKGDLSLGLSGGYVAGSVTVLGHYGVGGRFGVILLRSF